MQYQSLRKVIVGYTIKDIGYKKESNKVRCLGGRPPTGDDCEYLAAPNVHDFYH